MTNARVSWGCSDHQGTRGRLDHGVASVSYDEAALRPSHLGLADAAREVHRRGQSDAVRLGRAVRDRAGAARCAPEPDTHQPSAAGAGARRAEPSAADRPPLDPGAAGRYPRARGGTRPRAGHAGLPGGGRCGAREAVRQTLALGRLDVLVRPEAESVRLPYRVADVDQRPDRALAAAGRLSALAPQADLPAGTLSEEDRVGGDDAA